MSKLIKVELSRILIAENMDEQMIVLREVDGERGFPVMIGIYEAVSIDRAIKGISTPRPLTHDLFCAVLSSLNASIEHVEVDGLKNGTFYAKLVLKKDDKVIRIDCRPSDAIAIGVRAKCSIFVDEDILDNTSGVF